MPASGHLLSFHPSGNQRRNCCEASNLYRLRRCHCYALFQWRCGPDRSERLLDFQLQNGTDAVVVCGTTGESSTMSYRERMRTIEFCVEYVAGRVPVIAGSGSNSTEKPP